MIDIVTIPQEMAEQIRKHNEGGLGHKRGPWVLVDMEKWVSVCECGIKTVVSNDVLKETARMLKAEPLTFSFKDVKE